ncbi:MAG: multiheme c-type cytochrome [Fimbriimonadaceae bacterium]
MIQSISKTGDLIVELGPLSNGPGRQSEIKAETLAQSLKLMKTGFIALRSTDFELGDGVLSSLNRLSGAQLLRGDKAEIQSDEHWSMASDTGALTVDQVILKAQYLVENRERDQALIYITGLGRDDAIKVANAVPELDTIIYASHSNPEQQATRIGKTWLISPADEGKFVVSLKYTGDRFEAPVVYSLGPDIRDDPTTSRFYGQYLDRLRMEKLVQLMPKPSSEIYAGTEKCRSCHETAFQVWSKSKHSGAWATLKADKHDADPDCVGCHTVGIQSTGGFIVEEETPHLTNVGCESCHGAGSAHISAPEKVKLPKVGKDSCSPCHKLDHSPNFRYEEFWEKIKHF